MSWTVISPHLDDAVFGCGNWLSRHPGALVVTVFAGVPQVAKPPRWDVRCGFASAQEAVTTRRDEDRRALEELRAMPLWLPFFDCQYGLDNSRGAIVDALRSILAQRDPTRCVVPLGLFHTDHVLAHAAATAALGSLGVRSVLAYEDIPYRGDAELLHARIAYLRAHSIKATPVQEQAELPTPTKRAAICRYASQRGAYARADLELPERLWRLGLHEPHHQTGGGSISRS